MKHVAGLAGVSLSTVSRVVNDDPAVRADLARHGLALVGFDDVALGAVVQPGLTLLARDPAGLCGAAAELLLKRLDGPAQRLVRAPRLIARGSGQPAVAVTAA